ncbi:MAG: serine hydrolase family protein [Candidatus Aenigmarchaeota archaeon]|nr:serine hydrolase family protein [Candidatus Aenigmarchaeota archaeon]
MRKANFFIIHGAYGHPKENWFPWLKEELERRGFEVFVPKFPTPKDQSLKNWMNVFKKYEKYINENTIMIGHSLGPSFILSILEELDQPIKACFFVSGFIGLLNHPIDKINKAFVARDFNWEKIKRNCREFYLFHSDNDPYVPLEKAKELAKKLNGKLEIVKGAGHFNEAAGYKEFPLLLDKILKILK